MKSSKFFFLTVFFIMLSSFITAEGQNAKSNDIEYNLSSPQLILDVGNSGEFDSLFVSDPCPIVVNNEIYLYYTGWNEDYVSRIGVAKSENGETFNKIGVVLDIGNSLIDNKRVRDPMVIYDKTKQNYKMWYTGVGIDWTICYAESDTYNNFKRYKKNPIMIKASEENRIMSPMVIYENNKYKMWYDSRYDIMYAESKDGKKWHKVGNFVRAGEKGKWNSRGVGTSGIIIDKN
ncbi:hypothetical protein J7L48_10440 [bacterium]|nr:hypothetical protein [bacterium]